jgi:Dolichyl-phosphate-mannose-protein mannosyltransferase
LTQKTFNDTFDTRGIQKGSAMQLSVSVGDRASVQSAFFVLVLVFFSAIVLGAKLFGLFSTQDEAILVLYPDLIVRGYVPYRDFAFTYPPGTFYVLTAIYALFGNTLLVERIAGMGFQFAMVAALYALGARISRVTGFSAALLGLAVLALFPVPGAYPIFPALALLLFALVCSNRSCKSDSESGESRWAILAGALAGLVFWFRQEVGVIAVAATLVALDPLNWRRLRSYVVGLAIPIAAIIVFVLAVGPAYVYDSLVADVARMVPGRRLPLKMSLGLLGLLACAAVTLGIGLTIRASKTSRHLAWLIRSFAIVCVGLLPSALQRLDTWHLAYVGVIVAGLALISVRAVLIPSSWSERFTQYGRIVAASSAVVVCATAFVWSWGAVPGEPYTIAAGERWVYGWKMSGVTSDRSDLDSILAEVNNLASPGDKLFVGPHDLRFTNYNDTYLYYLLPELRPVSRYLEMHPGVANKVGSALAREVAAADWVILTSKYQHWREPNASAIAASNAPNEAVAKYFCTQSHHGPWHLLRRCPAVPAVATAQ